MNRTPDVELVLRAYLADDGDIAPDRVLEVVADRIAESWGRDRVDAALAAVASVTPEVAVTRALALLSDVRA